MNLYQVPALNKNTPKEDQNKLIAALKGIHGVENVTLKLDSSEFEIRPRKNQMPKHDQVTAVSQKAGFPVTPLSAQKV